MHFFDTHHCYRFARLQVMDGPHGNRAASAQRPARASGQSYSANGRRPHASKQGSSVAMNFATKCYRCLHEFINCLCACRDAFLCMIENSVYQMLHRALCHKPCSFRPVQMYLRHRPAEPACMPTHPILHLCPYIAFPARQIHCREDGPARQIQKPNKPHCIHGPRHIEAVW